MDPEVALAAQGKSGCCGVRLELAQAGVPWGGQLHGVVRLTGGERPQKLQFCEVRLTAPVQGSSTSLPSGVERWERVTVPAGTERELAFTLKVGWGTPGFGRIGVVNAYLVPSTFPWWPCVLNLMVDITPPPEFVRPASILAELAGLELGVWRVISGGDGAGMTLRPGDGAGMTLRPASSQHALERLDLTLYRSPERVYGFVVLNARRGPSCKVTLRLPGNDPAEVRRTLQSALEPILSGTEYLPIPSTRSSSVEALPIPAEPQLPSGEDLPRPAAGER